MNLKAVITGTLIIIFFTWSYSIRYQRYHGIPRFFSFLSIYLLLLLNIKYWFYNIFSWNQTISWIFLIMSAYIGLTGYITLKMKGRSTKNFENTSVLVKSGIYKLIRHPLYFSLFLLGTGTMMKEPSRIALILGTINLIAIYITAITEEKEMVSKFGKPYEDYIKETKMFIPYII